jgi:hypothetical protein
MAVCAAWIDEVPGSTFRWGADFRIAIRALARSPWYTAGVIGVLAAGITLSTVVFAVVDGVLFKSLPFARAGEVYLIRADATGARSSSRQP